MIEISKILDETYAFFEISLALSGQVRFIDLILTVHVARYIAFYSTTETADTAYIIGGQQMYSNIVAQYNDDNASPWQRLSNLNRGRYGHGSILVGDKTLVIGGWARESQE